VKLSRLERISWVWCSWVFGVVFVAVAVLLPSEKGIIGKMVAAAFALLFMCFYGTNSLLARLVEKDAARAMSGEAAVDTQ
jgi:hypothetical protein